MGNSPKGENMPNKVKIVKMLGIGIMSLFLFGCSNNSFLLTDEENLGMQELVEAQVESEDNLNLIEGKLAESEDNLNLKEGKLSEGKDILVAEVENANVNKAEATEENSPSKILVDAVEEVVVHICGAVKNSGVFILVGITIFIPSSNIRA